MLIVQYVLAVVNSLTLLVLCKYALDTKKIANNSSQQIENAQMPFIALVMKTDVERTSDWAIRNQGFGTAVNIMYLRYLPGKANPMMQWSTPLAPSEEYSLPRENQLAMRQGGFRVEYEALTGKKYVTAVAWTNGVMRTEFHKV